MFAFCLFVFVEGSARADGKAPYLNDDAQFGYARFLMSEGDALGASREFQRLIVDFPASPLLPKAQFNMAEALFKAGNIREAERVFRLFISNFGGREPLLEAQAVRRVNEALVIKRKAGIPVVRLEPETSTSPLAPPSLKNRRGKPVKGIDTPPSSPLAVKGEVKWKGSSSLRAAQVMLFSGQSLADVSGEMARLKQAGVNTVIFRVFHNEGDRFHRGIVPPAGKKSGVYFKSSHAPLIADILSDVADEAHRNGLKIFAWMTTRYADYGIEGREDIHCKGYDIATGRPIACKGLDIFNDEAVRRIEGIYSDLGDYEIDGLLFQDDLVLKHNEGYGEYAAALFMRDIGEALRPGAMYLRQADTNAVKYTPLFWKWARWKNSRLLHVAKVARAAVRKKRPEARFAINLMYECVSNPANSLAWLSQSFDAAVKEEFDYYSIMAYHRQMASELSKDPAAVKALIKKIAQDAARLTGDAGKVLVKFQTIDWTTGQSLSSGEVNELIHAVKGLKGISLAVVPYRKDFAFHELGGSGKAGEIARLD